MSILVKDPSSMLDYELDWKTDGYLGSSESISASSWTVDPGSSSVAMSIVHSTFNSTAGTATVTLSTGVHAVMYKVTNKITTNSSYTDERSFFIRVWEPR